MPALSRCPSCPELTPGGRCPACKAAADKGRGTAAQRGYTGKAHAAFRRAVLARNPICVLCHARPSAHADHHPVDRRTLVRRGANPNDPKHGRGLCASCHSRETARHQPGGWNVH